MRKKIKNIKIIYSEDKESFNKICIEAVVKSISREIYARDRKF
ncbi:MAG: hypothetical protein Q8936_10185 [Bacillota bacterium]|nr:hypothetical protein [Bacillota bacterium]